MNDKKSASPPAVCPAPDTAARLAALNTLVTHGRSIADDAEAVVRSLRENHINPQAYRIDESLSVNLAHMQEIAAGNSDYHFREFTISPLNRKAAIIFLEAMVDSDIIATHLIEKLTLTPLAGITKTPPQGDVLSYLKNTLLTAASLSEEPSMAAAVKRLLAGDTLLLVDGVATFIIVESRKMEKRAITEPETESDVRAAREGFVEDLRTNISLIRRRLRNPNLIIRRFSIGVRSDTDVAMIYFRGITASKIVCEVERRLQNISIDAPIGSGSIQGLIEDHPYSPFPTMLATERPDKVVANLVEGKVAVIIDGSPFALLAPASLGDFFQTSDDYNEKWLIASLFRLTRYITALIGVVTPAVYIAITTFHPGLLPTPLTITIANARMGIPFPVFLEALIMEALLEILQEAGVRLPKTIGPAVSIVGGLVIGEATVRAGLVSAPIVIVIAVTAVASFNIANYRLNLVVRLLRVPLMVLGASFGMFGVILGLFVIAVHLSLLESFGVPYLAPFIPKTAAQLAMLKDTVIIAPPALLDERPAYLDPQDATRQDN